MKNNAVDELIFLGHAGSCRTLDCVVSIKTPFKLNLKELVEGAKKAQQVFPKTAKYPVKIFNDLSFNQFSEKRLVSMKHVELLMLSEYEVALKMSHYLGDLVSMLLWLKKCLGKESSNKALKLKALPAKRNTPYKYFLNSSVWPAPVKNSSDRRSFYRFEIDHALAEKENLRVNDVFLLAILRSLQLKRKSIWVPVNVREDFFEGFGNGLSRMRIYPPASELPLKDQLDYIREQKKQAYTNGELSLPPKNLKLNGISRLLVKGWIKRPSADWCSLSFSHMVDRKGGLNWIEDISAVSNIGPRHNMAIFAFTKDNRTQFSLSADQANVSNEQVDQFKQALESHVGEILNDLNTK